MKISHYAFLGAIGLLVESADAQQRLRALSTEALDVDGGAEVEASMSMEIGFIEGGLEAAMMSMEIGFIGGGLDVVDVDWDWSGGDLDFDGGAEAEAEASMMSMKTGFIEGGGDVADWGGGGWTGAKSAKAESRPKSATTPATTPATPAATPATPAGGWHGAGSAKSAKSESSGGWSSTTPAITPAGGWFGAGSTKSAKSESGDWSDGGKPGSANSTMSEGGWWVSSKSSKSLTCGWADYGGGDDSGEDSWGNAPAVEDLLRLVDQALKDADTKTISALEKGIALLGRILPKENSEEI